MSTQEPTGARQGTEKRLGVRKIGRSEDFGQCEGAHVALAIVVIREDGPSVARSQPFHKKPEIQILM